MVSVGAQELQLWFNVVPCRCYTVEQMYVTLAVTMLQCDNDITVFET